MTAGVFTTVVDILGGQDVTDEWGYPAEGEEVILAGVPARITERPARVASESQPQAVTVHYYTARLPAGTVVTKDQRIRDHAGTLYVIDYVNAQPTNPVMPADVRLDLRRVT